MTLTETLQKEDLGWVLTLANSSNQRDKELLLAKVNVLVAHTVRTTVEQIESEVLALPRHSVVTTKVEESGITKSYTHAESDIIDIITKYKV